MERTVFFREGKNIFRADLYIENEPEYFRTALNTIAGLLSSNGFIEGYRAIKLANGDWSVWLQNPKGELVNYSLFISILENKERPGANPVIAGKPSSKKRELVIINPAGAKDSAGGFHPGYWSVSDYIFSFEPMAAKYFMETVAEILAGIPSENYSVQSNKNISIHIHKPEKAYAINIQCTAMWI